MKFSVILVSVNIAATLPIAVAGSALANEGAQSDKADWLKSSLASLDTSVNQKKGLHAHRLSLSQPMPDTSGGIVMHSNGVKLRPFVPNRKLPSQHDLDVQFIAQSAKTAQDSTPTLQSMTPQMAQGALTGQVSESYGAAAEPASIANYGSLGYSKQTSSRVVPGQQPAVPGQIRQFRPTKKTKYVSQPVRPPQEQQLIEQPMQAFRMPSNNQGSLLQQQTFQPSQMQSFQAPAQQTPPSMMSQQTQQFAPQQNSGNLNITPDEQSIIDRMVAQSQPHAGEGAPPSMLDPGAMSMSGMPSASAGPPPFPLNLLPQESLKQIIGGMRRSRTDAAPSYFGSWRGNSMSSLASGGFHTYAKRGAYKHQTPRSAVAVHTAHQSLPVAAKHVEPSHSMAQLRRLPPHDYKVATYPAYPRFNGASAVAY